MGIVSNLTIHIKLPIYFLTLICVQGIASSQKVDRK